jgi:hypothetical protein
MHTEKELRSKRIPIRKRKVSLVSNYTINPRCAVPGALNRSIAGSIARISGVQHHNIVWILGADLREKIRWDPATGGSDCGTY